MVQFSPGIVFPQSVVSTWLALRSGTAQLPGVGVVVAVVVVLVPVMVSVVMVVVVVAVTVNVVLVAVVVIRWQLGTVPTRAGSQPSVGQ